MDTAWGEVGISPSPCLPSIPSIKFQSQGGWTAPLRVLSFLSFPADHHEKGGKVCVDEVLCPDPASTGVALLLRLLFFLPRKFSFKKEF